MLISTWLEKHAGVGGWTQRRRRANAKQRTIARRDWEQRMHVRSARGRATLKEQGILDAILKRFGIRSQP